MREYDGIVSAEVVITRHADPRLLPSFAVALATYPDGQPMVRPVETHIVITPEDCGIVETREIVGPDGRPMAYPTGDISVKDGRPEERSFRYSLGDLRITER